MSTNLLYLNCSNWLNFLLLVSQSNFLKHITHHSMN